MGSLRQHYEKWKDCRGCEYSERRTQVVFARGMIPAPILFVGEAPGDHEDVHGKPFWGPAGRHPSCGLQSMIDQAIDGQLDYCITNLVGCIPLGEDMVKESVPSPESVDACRPKLDEFITLCKPKLIVCVGEPSWERLWNREGPEQIIQIRHPAYILRSDITRRGLLVQENVVDIEEAIQPLL